MIAVTLLIGLNLTLVIASAITLLLHGSEIRASAKQQLVRFAFVIALVSPIIATLASRTFEPVNIFEPPIQVAANSPKSDQPVIVTTATANSADMKMATERASYAALIFALLTTGAAALRLLRLFKDKRTLARLSRQAFTLRRLGRLKIQLSSQTRTPFAARHLNEALIVIPESLIGTDAMSVAIHHELQHHRQNDLQWNALLEVARLIAGWNPLVRKALERSEEIDELACDENLLGRGQMDVNRYANGLFEAALATQNHRQDAVRLAGTARMATSPNFLKRRIEMTLQEKKPQKTFVTFATTAAIVLITGATAWAGQGLIKDRRVSQAQAESYAKKINSSIPIVINKRVLKYLNLATGTPRTRFYMRNALKRMKQYQPMIESKLAAAGLPNDLLAVPAVESGYQNHETMIAAGLWQFVPDTARRYGLQVDDLKDERLDPAKETDAAIAYFAHLQSIFQNDWMLSLLSYNAGEKTVQEIVAKTGERDVFKLADEGKIPNEENANYVAKFIVALIIINNPNLVAE
jgi:beta-lactamase regulating signal transducer with metallopeptidase domain